MTKRQKLNSRLFKAGIFLKYKFEKNEFYSKLKTLIKT